MAKKIAISLRKDGGHGLEDGTSSVQKERSGVSCGAA